MKYGLITIHATQNFGSLLQTFCTYEAVRSLGKDVTLIDYRNSKIAEREIPFSDRPAKSLKDLLKKIMWGPDQKEKYDGIFKFLHEHTTLSRLYDSSNIKNCNEEFDAFITGSDLVWATNITGQDMNYFLDFVDSSKKKISFSSSIGTKWSQEESENVRPLLNRYDSLSVREKLASEWIKELTGRDVCVTCDPTILWDVGFWSSFVKENYIPKEKYVLIYAVNPDRKNIVDGISFADRNGLKAYFVNFYASVKGTKTVRPTTVEQWITLFANAEVVFSASYHGLLFSLYFHRPVYFYNRGEKSRMISLAEELHIENRQGINDYVDKAEEIDFDFIDKVFAEKRDFSWNYLRENL